MSACVIILYSLYFAPSPEEVKKLKAQQEKKQLVQETESPKIEQEEKSKSISREESILQSDRINFALIIVCLTIIKYEYSKFTFEILVI